MNKKIKIGLLVLVGLLVAALAFAGNYFYNYAVVPGEKDFLSGESHSKEYLAAEKWLQENRQQDWQITSKDGLRLSAIYVPAENSQKTAIIAHGYMSQANTMGEYAQLFHDLGYNVLMPDARGHGKREGDYVGFGWDERKDYQQWVEEVVKKNPDEKIILDGVSMGAATVMMTSGEKLPKNVKAIIEDCGYSSTRGELAYQLKEMFGLPSFPLMEVTSLTTKLRAGYFLGEADAIKQLEKNKRPMLFIHGDKDDFVPFEMLDEVYQATKGPKEKLVIKGAGHALAYATDPELYRQTIENFLNQYV